MMEVWYLSSGERPSFPLYWSWGCGPEAHGHFRSSVFLDNDGV